MNKKTLLTGVVLASALGLLCVFLFLDDSIIKRPIHVYKGNKGDYTPDVTKTKRDINGVVTQTKKDVNGDVSETKTDINGDVSETEKDINGGVSETKRDINGDVSESNTINRTIYILWYKLHEYFSIRSLSNCPYSNCVMTTNKSLLEISDAVLFGYDPRNKNRPKKKKGQMWVIVHVESPANNRALHKIWNGAIDWSMTYRRDSEVLINYSVYKRNGFLKKNYHEIFKNKTKSVAWAVSNCWTKSLRGTYVRELKKYIDVDIYGSCVKKKCPGNSMIECHENLSQNYKFYLAFENSLCVDYATEKIFHTFLDNSNAVYVARGAPNIKSILPPKTFVDARDFSSPKALAEYLNDLGSNETGYISYLRETDKYQIKEGYNYFNAMCNLCEILNTRNTKQFAFTGRNFNKFYRENACERPKDI